MFKLSRSTWNDYNKKLISKGGGVFSRHAKKVDLSPEIQRLLGCKEEHLTPNELIVYILKAPVDLIWNGGIGTYFKASSETDTDVSDKSNDAIRINGDQIRGGNLGITQLGRVEYAQAGGLNYTDSIDNSAGVNCSDKEVNIKILLSQQVKSGQLSAKERNQLLVDMTDEVAQKCLFNNYRQTQIIDSIERHAPQRMHQHARFMRHLETERIMNRRLDDTAVLQQIDIQERPARRIFVDRRLLRPVVARLFSTLDS